jgi:hypothetical protein
MGVSDLWHFLRASGAMREWSAESEGPAAVQKACAAQVEGLVVAVDLSLWACQALSQPDLGEAFKRDEARVLKVVFDRVRLLMWPAAAVCMTHAGAAAHAC